LFEFWVAYLIARYMLQSVYAPSSADHNRMMTVKTALENLATTNPITSAAVQAQLATIMNLTNINCSHIVEAIYHSGYDGHWNWMEFLYSARNRPSMLATGDIPNPLILPTMFNPEQQCQVCVDSESSVPISDGDNHSLFRFLTANMTKSVFAGDTETTTMYKAYSDTLENMFNVQFNISPGENIRTNTAQIPTLSYHGNMKVKQGSFVHEDIKCIGHLGNSYPGMASVREGRGVQTMNAPTSLVHIQ
jgi:hypothetical protein